MEHKKILDSLAKSGHLASRTHKRALTHSLLNKALSSSLIQGTSAVNVSSVDSHSLSSSTAPKCDTFKQQYSQHKARQMGSFTLKPAHCDKMYNKRSEVPSQKIEIDCKTYNGKHDMKNYNNWYDEQNDCQRQFMRKRFDTRSMTTWRDYDRIRKGSDRQYMRHTCGYDHMKLCDKQQFMRNCECPHYIRSSGCQQFMRNLRNQNYVIADNCEKIMKDNTDDQQDLRMKSSRQYMTVDDSNQYMKTFGSRTLDGHQHRADNVDEYIRALDDHQRRADDDHEHIRALDDHQYIRLDDDPQRRAAGNLGYARTEERQHHAFGEHAYALVDDQQTQEDDDDGQYLRNDKGQDLKNFRDTIDVQQNKRTSNSERSSDAQQFKRSNDVQQFKGSNDVQQFKGSNDVQQFKGSNDAQLLKRSSSAQVYERSNDDKVFKRTSDGQVFKRTSNDQAYDRTGDIQVYERASNDQVYEKPSDDQVYEKPSDDYVFRKSSDNLQYNSNSDGLRLSRYSDDLLHCDQPAKCNIDATMIHMSELMNNISHLCEVYYDSCPKKKLSHSDRKHLRTYHKGVLPVGSRVKKKRKKSKMKSNEGSISSLSSSASSDNEDKPEGSVRFSDSAPLDLYIDQLDVNSHFAKVFVSPKGLSNFGQMGTASSSSSDECVGMDKSRDSVYLMKSHTGQLNESVYPLSMPSYDCVQSTSLTKASSYNPVITDLKPKQYVTKNSRSISQTRQKGNDTKKARSNSLTQQKGQGNLTGVNLSKYSYVEGVSAFPTTAAYTQPKCKEKPDVHFHQGIYIATKPGTYIIRKPQKDSSIHLLHVNPGNFVKLNM